MFCQKHGSSLGVSISKREAQSTVIRVTEQPILLIKSNINRPGYEFCKYFH